MSEHHVSKDELPAIQLDDYEGRSTEMGALVIAFESMPAAFPPDPATIFAGLEDDHCQCEHWGYLFSGSFKVMLSDGDEFVVNAGETYHLPPGHRVQTVEPVELLEFSPKDEHARTMAQIERNVAALQQAAATS